MAQSMVFSSHVFLFYFLPVVLLAYHAMPKAGKHLLLTVLSYAFYGWANPAFMLLMWVSTLIDYVAGLVIARDPTVPGGPRTRTPNPALAHAKRKGIISKPRP